MVNSLAYGRRLARQTVELAYSFLRKDQAREVSASTNPDTMTARTYRCAFLPTNTNDIQRVTWGDTRAIIVKYATMRPVEDLPVRKPQVEPGHTPIEAYPSTYIL